MTNTEYRKWLEKKIENLDNENQYYVKKAMEDCLRQFNDLCESDEVEFVKLD